MASKTIINGIDVSKCKFYQSLGRHIFCFCTDLRNGNMPFGIHCENYKDCYYKQLKRKEQECEILKQSENEAGEIIAELKNDYTELENECEKLKEKIKAYQEDRFCQGGCAIYQYDKIHKLTQALDKIEKYCQETISDEQSMSGEHLACDDILDIIDKAKGMSNGESCVV